MVHIQISAATLIVLFNHQSDIHVAHRVTLQFILNSKVQTVYFHQFSHHGHSMLSGSRGQMEILIIFIHIKS